MDVNCATRGPPATWLDAVGHTSGDRVARALLDDDDIGLRTVYLLNCHGPQELVSSDNRDHNHAAVLADRTFSLDCSVLFRAKLWAGRFAGWQYRRMCCNVEVVGLIGWRDLNDEAPSNFQMAATRARNHPLRIRWYLRYSLSLRDVEELLIERGLGADHTTVWRWVQRYAPELEQRMRQHLKSTNNSWRVDET